MVDTEQLKVANSDESLECNSAYAEEEDETSPLCPKRSSAQLVSNTKTLMNILRGMIGPGCLSLPMSFKYAGLWFGFGMTFIVGLINTHCMGQLVTSSQHLCKLSDRAELDYGHLAKKVFDHGPLALRKHSKKALLITNILICVFQMGVCSVQLVFISSNLHKVVQYFGGPVLNVSTYLYIIVLPVILLCFVRSLKLLSVLSTLGNGLMIVCFAVIFQLIVRPPNKVNGIDWWFHDFKRLLLFYGSILYAFEGQAMKPKDMVAWCGVLQTGMSFVAIIYAATGFYGFATFGEQVAGSVTLNLPNEPLYQAVNIILILAVYQGYALQFYVIVEMLWPAILRKLASRWHSKKLLLEAAFRVFIILVQFTLAITVPKLESIIPLVGVTAGSVISLILPPLFETVTFWNYYSDQCPEGYRSLKRTVWVAKNFTLVALGVFGLCAGLYASLSNAADPNS